MKINQFLRGRIVKNGLERVLADNGLYGVEVRDFFQKFGKMTKDELVEFLQNNENAYEIAKFGYRYKGRDNIRARVRYSYDAREQAY